MIVDYVGIYYIRKDKDPKLSKYFFLKKFSSGIIEPETDKQILFKNNGAKKLWNTLAEPYAPKTHHLNEEETVLNFTVDRV